MKKKFVWPILGVVFFSQTYFQCRQECFVPDVPIHSAQIQVTNLENRGAEPVVLPSGAEGFLKAYRFRLSMHLAENQVDTIKTTCPFFFAFDPSFTNCAIFTLTDLDSSHSAGSSVSDLFRYVDRYNSTKFVHFLHAGAGISFRISKK